MGVADGMGGLARGDYASGIVIDALFHHIKTNNLADCIRDLEIRLRQAHSNCRNAFQGERGSTVAALYYSAAWRFSWAGDSRIYRLRNRQLSLLTTDHTIAQSKIASKLSPQQAARHPLHTCSHELLGFIKLCT